MADFSIADILARGYQQRKDLLAQPYGFSNVLPAAGQVAQQGFQLADQNRKQTSVMQAQKDYSEFLSLPPDQRSLPQNAQKGYQAALSLGINPQTMAMPKTKTPQEIEAEAAARAKGTASVKPVKSVETEEQKLSRIEKESRARAKGSGTLGQRTQGESDKIAKMWQSNINNILPTIAKRGSPLGIAAVNNQRKDRLLEIARNPNPSPQEVKLMETDLAGVMQGGSPQEDTLRATHYGSMYQDWANFKGKITGTPQDANSPEIVAQLKKIALGVGSVDNKVITDNLAMIEKYPSMTYLIKKDPQGWSNFKQTMMGTLVMDSPVTEASPSPHPQDSEAVTWAKANPKDPRAAKILNLNGQ